jgi:hypothetical protein
MIDIAGWLIGGLILLGLISFLVLFQHRFIYFPLRYSANQLEDARATGVREVKFETTQGSQIAFFWQEGDSKAAPQTLVGFCWERRPRLGLVNPASCFS